jgi:hypothetical protein
MIYFDSDMSKSTNTVVYFDWKTVIYIYACGKCRTQFMLPMEKSVTFTIEYWIIFNSNITSFFRFVNKRANYPFGIISLAHAPVNVTAFSIGSIHCVRHFPQTYT